MAANGNPPAEGPPTIMGLHRRWLVNLGLLALVATLTGFLLFHRQQQQETAAGTTLTAIAPERVSRVRIERPGQPPMVLEQHEGRWHLAAPFKARANRFSVQQVLSLTQARSALALTADDAHSYGLATPQAQVWLNDERIELGALHPFRPQVYVRYHNVIHLIPANLLGPALRPPGHFVDGSLIDPEQHITGLRLPGFRLTLRDGAWQRSPADASLTSDRLSNFVAQWTNAQALSVDVAGRQPALATIEITVSGTEKKSKIITLDVIAYKPTLVLRRRDERLDYHFPEETGKRLFDTGGG